MQKILNEKGEDITAFSLHKKEPLDTFYYGSDPLNNFADYFSNSNPDQNKTNPLIILIHGGYWRPQISLDYFRPLASAFAEEGFETLSIEYSRIPGNPDAYIKDVKDAVNNLPEKIKNFNGKIILIGHSVGGYFSLLTQLELKDKIYKNILLAPVLNLQRTQKEKIQVDVVDKFLGMEAEKRKDIDPFYLEFPQGKVVIIQGNKDLRVPVDFTREYLNRGNKFIETNNENGDCSEFGNKENIKYIELEEIGHFEFANPNEENIFKIMLDELKN